MKWLSTSVCPDNKGKCSQNICNNLGARPNYIKLVILSLLLHNPPQHCVKYLTPLYTQLCCICRQLESQSFQLNPTHRFKCIHSVFLSTLTANYVLPLHLETKRVLTKYKHEFSFAYLMGKDAVSHHGGKPCTGAKHFKLRLRMLYNSYGHLIPKGDKIWGKNAKIFTKELTCFS